MQACTVLNAANATLASKAQSHRAPALQPKAQSRTYVGN